MNYQYLRIFRTLLLALIALGVIRCAQLRAAVVGAIDSTNSLINYINPNSANTNYFLMSDTGTIADGTAAIWTYDSASSTDDADHIKPLLFTGRWVRNFRGIGGTNIFNTLIVTNLYLSNLYNFETNLFQTFTTTNITFETNVTFNETVNLTTNTYITTNVFITYEGGTNQAGFWVETNGFLQPLHLDLQPLIANGLEVGTNTFAFYGLASSGEALVSVSVPGLGDTEYKSIYLGSSLTLSQSDASGVTELGNYTNRVYWSAIVTSNSVPSTITFNVDPELRAAAQRLSQAFTFNNVMVGQFSPAVVDGSGTPAWIFGTFESMATDPIAVMQNNGTNILTFGPTAKIIWGPGTTNVLYRSGSDLVYTNGATAVELELRNGTGRSTFVGMSSSGQTELRAGNGSTTVFLHDGTDIVELFGGSFMPNTTVQLGSAASNGAWNGAYIKDETRIVGQNDGAGNYAWVRCFVTNGIAVFDYANAGSGIAPTKFSFRTNGVEVGTFP